MNKPVQTLDRADVVVRIQPAAKSGHSKLTTLLMLLLLALALFLRLYGLSWDGGYLFHPDERQILIVTDEISFPWPPDWSSLLTPKSPWNPKFFAYGALPIYLLRICADVAGQFDAEFAMLNASYLVGRVLSTLFDVGTIYLIYRLGRKLYDERVGLLAATLVTLTVLHIQLAHFYAVDTVLAFFVVLTVLLATSVVQRPRLGRSVPLGIGWGMALATKISAAPLLVPIVLAWLSGALSRTANDGVQRRASKPALWSRAILGCTLTGLTALVTFILCQPYALIDVVTFVIDIVQESYMARGAVDIPYTRQYIGTLPYLYPLWQMVLWSMGLPLGLTGLGASLAAMVHIPLTVYRKNWRKAGELFLPLSWVGIYFGLVGSFHAKFLRYMLPIIPFICLWTAWALVKLLSPQHKVFLRALGRALLIVVLGGTTLYALAYLNVYTQEHPWIQATAWLCEHLSKPSHIMVEHWDDSLPMVQGTGELRCYRYHEFKVFRAYYPDTTKKLADLLDSLEECDAVILSSNRLYNTIPRLPNRYPLSSRYYELLLGEHLGYELVYYVAVYPELFGVRLVNDTFSDPDLPRPRLLAEQEALRPSINLGRADESYSVYDHPKPLVFRKTRQLSRQELLDLFGDAARNLPEPETE